VAGLAWLAAMLLAAAIGLTMLLLPVLVLTLLLLALLVLALLLQVGLIRHDEAVIVLGVLEVVLGHDAIAGRVRVARELEILLVDMVRVAADLHIRPVRINRAVNVEDLILALLAALVARTATAAAATAAVVLAAAAATATLVVVVVGSRSHVHWEFRLTLSFKSKNLFCRWQPTLLSCPPALMSSGLNGLPGRPVCDPWPAAM
jgi:hypothetical protein